MTAAPAQPEHSPFWKSAGEPLPVERDDFEFTIAATGWRLKGTRANHDVQIYPGRALPASATALRPYKWHRRLRDLVSSKPGRPDNRAAKYRRTVYGSREPFCGFG